MRAVLEFLSPFHRRGMYAVPHAIAALVILAALALAGVFAVQTYNAHFYRTTYKATLKVPHVYKTVHVKPKLAASLPSTGSIYLQYFTTATNDQGKIGSCQGWAFVKQASYAFNWNRQPNGRHWHRFFSPRYVYDMVSAGQDQGSYLEQYPPIARTGIPRWITFPYGSYQVDYPVPTLTPLYQLNVTETQLFADQGAGSGGVVLIKKALTTHHAVNFDFPVFPEYDQANADGSTVILPKPGETDRGGHANTCVKFDDNHQNGDGTVGAVLCSNQWNNYAGVGADGVRHSGPNNGFIWFSYSFVGAEVWDAAVIHVSTAPAAPPPPHKTFPYVPSHAPLHRAPAFASKPRHKAPAGAAPQVYNVYTADTHVNLSNAINQAAAQYGFSAPGFAALMGVESGIRQYAPHYPINGAGYCDYSGGLTQITVCTAAGLGIGNGTTSPANIAYVFWYEQQDAIRDVWLSARLVAEFHRAVCWDWPELYASWNEGPGYGCYAAEYRYPSNWITRQAVASYASWYNLMYAQHVTYYRPPPPPKPVHHYKFPKRTYEQYRRRHHLKPISPYYHHKLSFAASTWWTVQNKKGREVLGGIVRPERWNSRREVMTGYYQSGKIFTWPSRHGWNPVVKRHRWIR